jgi:hypothetical protein
VTFTPAELREEINRVLDVSTVVPKGHKGAFVAYYDDAGVRTAIAFKTTSGWEVQGTIGWHEHEKNLNYGVNIMKTW